MVNLSLFVIYLLTNGFKYEDAVNSLKMTSNYTSTDIAGNVLGNVFDSASQNGNSNSNNPTKLQNDIDCTNTTGNTLTGDLNLNGNKLYFNDNKKQSIYKNSDDFVLETDDKFIVKK